MTHFKRVCASVVCWECGRHFLYFRRHSGLPRRRCAGCRVVRQRGYELKWRTLKWSTDPLFMLQMRDRTLALKKVRYHSDPSFRREHITRVQAYNLKHREQKIAYLRQYVEKNRETLRQKDRGRYHNNEKRKAYVKAHNRERYRNMTPEQKKVYNQSREARRRATPEAIARRKEQRRQNVEANREHYREVNRERARRYRAKLKAAKMVASQQLGQGDHPGVGGAGDSAAPVHLGGLVGEVPQAAGAEDLRVLQTPPDLGRGSGCEGGVPEGQGGGYEGTTQRGQGGPASHPGPEGPQQ